MGDTSKHTPVILYAPLCASVASTEDDTEPYSAPNLALLANGASMAHRMGEWLIYAPLLARSVGSGRGVIRRI